MCQNWTVTELKILESDWSSSIPDLWFNWLFKGPNCPISNINFVIGQAKSDSLPANKN